MDDPLSELRALQARRHTMTPAEYDRHYAELNRANAVALCACGAVAVFVTRQGERKCGTCTKLEELR